VVDCWDTAICRAATPCHWAGSSAGASIINGGGEYVSLAEIFLRKLLRFCLSRLAIGSQNRTPVVKIHAATKKRILLFGRMRAKSLVDIFRQMG